MSLQTITSCSRTGCINEEITKVIDILRVVSKFKVTFCFPTKYAILVPDVVTLIKGRYYIRGEFNTKQEANAFVNNCRDLKQDFINNFK